MRLHNSGMKATTAPSVKSPLCVGGVQHSRVRAFWLLGNVMCTTHTARRLALLHPALVRVHTLWRTCWTHCVPLKGRGLTRKSPPTRPTAP